MSNEIVIVAPQSLAESDQLSTMLAKSALLPEALKGKQADILAVILTGAELGFAPMQSVRGINIIKGKPSLGADAMGALVKRRADVCEYLSLKEATATRCTYETKRRGEPTPTTMSFTIEDAQRAGLVQGGGMYSKYPAAMLRARCQSAICRAVYPDLCFGIYDPEELAEVQSQSPVEKDVTPKSSNPTQALKQAVKAKVEVVKPATTPATVAVSPPVSPDNSTPKSIVDQVIDGEIVESPYERIRALCIASGKKGKEASDFVKQTTGRTKASEFTQEDVEKVTAALNATDLQALEGSVE
jgi:hypothetical protein